jgi:hypothetical protein
MEKKQTEERIGVCKDCHEQSCEGCYYNFEEEEGENYE